jgi:hypothetical protein
VRLLKRIMDWHYQSSTPDQYKEKLHDTIDPIMNARIPQHGVLYLLAVTLFLGLGIVIVFFLVCGNPSRSCPEQCQ